MSQVIVTLADGSKKEFEKGEAILKVAESISKRLAKEALGAKVDGVVTDIKGPLEKDAEIEILTFDSEEGQNIFRHSAAHIMAQAVQKLFPGVKYAIGPAIKDGFYYDFEVEKPFSPEDLEKIEKEMQKIVENGFDFERSEMTIDEAVKYFEERQDPYKLELIEGLKEKGEEKVSIYSQGDFTDLCTGPHIPHTGFLKSFKLLSIAGAYWRGDSNRQMLQRIYGTAFSKEKDLKKYLNRLEEAKQRDHRKIGKELDLFSFQEEGPGFPFWHPKGTKIYDILVDFMRKENNKLNYNEVKTPIILNQSLWEASGHYENFKDNMYFTKIDERDFAVKPMNCPGHCIVYKNSLKSYRDLPFKLAEFGLVHRHELSGVLHGLFRVRNFTQDDAHIYCTEDQLKELIVETVDFVVRVYKIMGFASSKVFIATKPEKYIGSDDVWEKATNSLVDALKELKIEYSLKEGEGAFYGPKIEFNIEDSLERYWQCGTIQVDFSMPNRLELTYEGSDSKKHTPVMIHRAVLGSLERFIGILIEHYAGKFPLWMCPVQIKLLPLIDKHQEYAKELFEILQNEGFRVEIDDSNEKLGYKIRKSQLEKIPFMVILGDNELEKRNISVRSRDKADLGSFEIDAFISFLKEESKVTENLVKEEIIK